MKAFTIIPTKNTLITERKNCSGVDIVAPNTPKIPSVIKAQIIETIIPLIQK